METCKVENCCHPKKSKGYCQKHYFQIIRNGVIYDNPKTNNITIKGKTANIEMLDKKGNLKGYAKIDKEDVDKVKKYKWSFSHEKKYVATKIDSKFVTLHKFILGEKSGYEIDHINRIPSDNRKGNLRYATRSQQNMNRKFGRNKGITFDKRTNKYRVSIKKEYNEYNLGFYKNLKDARLAREVAEKVLFKEFYFKNKKAITSA